MKSLVFLLGLALLATAKGEPTPAAPSLPTKPQMEEELQELTDLYVDNWAYVAEKEKQTGHSLEELHRQALGELGDVHSMGDFQKVVTRFVSRLEDGHSWVVPPVPTDKTYYALPFRLRATREGLVVSEIKGTQTGLKVGDIVSSLDGQPVGPLVDKLKEETFVSCNPARLHQVLQANLYLSEKARVSVAGRRNNQDFTVDLATNPSSELMFSLPHDWIHSEVVSPGVGLVRIKTFYPDADKRQEMNKRNAPDAEWRALDQKNRRELEAAMGVIQDCGTLVVDLRGNGGGTDQMGFAAASYFVPPGKDYYRIEWRNCPFIRAHHADIDFRHLPVDFKGEWFESNFSKTQEKPAHPLYDKRVVLLTDEGCFSATADFISAMQAYVPHLRIVGRAEDAGAGGPRQLGILKHSQMEIWGSTCRVYRPDGTLLEGHPVMPDVPIEWTQADVAEGRDPDMAAALVLAGKTDW